MGLEFRYRCFTDVQHSLSSPRRCTTASPTPMWAVSSLRSRPSSALDYPTLIGAVARVPAPGGEWFARPPHQPLPVESSGRRHLRPDRPEPQGGGRDGSPAGGEAGVRVLIDAEHSWIQDVIDDLAREMMQKYNQHAPIVYNTYQLYRHDKLASLEADYYLAETAGFFLGAKLVRGEHAATQSPAAAAPWRWSWRIPPRSQGRSPAEQIF